MSISLLVVFVLTVALFSSVSTVHAQDVGGGVDVDGDWWVGEGLKVGDQFSYRLCHVDYKECQVFVIDFWLERNIQVGSEEKWLAKAVVYDGHKIIKGDIEFSKIAASPTGGDAELITHRTAFKSSVSWLSSFATSYGGQGGEGPKSFNVPSWGKIANIGGQQVKPISIEYVTVPAGTFEDSIKIGWRTGGVNSYIWIVDDFPFPIKASTWTHVSTGKPPQEYAFTLLEYKENVESDPFADVIPTTIAESQLGCPNLDNIKYTSIKRSTKNFAYGLEILYKPEEPKQGCDIDWLIKFKSKYSENEFLNQVQYDIWVVDDQNSIPPIRSLAAGDNKEFLYSPSGLAERTMTVMEPTGSNNFMIIVYGLAPDYIVIDSAKTPIDFLVIPINIKANDAQKVDPPPAMPKIPSWVKANAGLWDKGEIDGDTFIAALQYLIQEGIIIIPDTIPGESSDNKIPSWFKDNAGFWSKNQIDDKTFITALQYLIEHGIIVIS